MASQSDQGEWSNGNEDVPEPNELSDVWLIEGLGEWTDVSTNEDQIEEPDEWPPEEPEEWPVEEPDEWPPEEPYERPEEPDGPPNLSFLGGVDE